MMGRVSRCSSLLTHFCHVFSERCKLRSSMPTVKTHGFVVGLLYLMRTGIRMWDSVELLPQVSVGQGLGFPLENFFFS